MTSLLLLIFFDQRRLQPRIYQYLLFFIIFILHDRQTEHKPDSNQTLIHLQILIAGLYIWSGIRKLNFAFSGETLPFLLTPLANFLTAIRLPPDLLGPAAALIESFIGAGLLHPKTRNFAVWPASMHLFILGLLLAANYNSIVWIWNAALIVIVIFSFGAARRRSNKSLSGVKKMVGKIRLQN